MSRIKGQNTKPEHALRRALWALGLRYRIHHPVPGRPDVVFPAQRIAIFVDGCFWHGCPEHWVQPKTNEAFWSCKIGRNIERDLKVTSTLRAEGWRVLRFWEHELKKDLPQVIEKILCARQGCV